MGIKILDDFTINKIAAGEVVENPAAVVKELVENSIDAGSSAITIEIEGGGIKKIRVTDNGQGIDSSEIELAFLRHATSKITDAKDLSGIASLGFRGEALASIAAVSMVHIATKTRKADMGCEMHLEGGKVTGTKAAGLPNGTTITVNNLFFNTPARLKFLKSVAQETATITDNVSRLILSHPELSFKYICNGETIYHSPGSGDLKEALFCVYGRELMPKIVSVDYTYDNIHVYGYIGLPQYAFKNRRYQIFIVNGRVIRAQNLSGYIHEAYSQRLLKGHYPFVLLYMDLAYGFTDVNVHPNKLTIRFKDEQKIQYILCEAVNDALSGKPVTGFIRISSDTEKPPDKTITKPTYEKAAPVHEDKTQSPEYEPLKKNESREVTKQADFFTSIKPETTLHADDGIFFDIVKAIEEREEQPTEEEIKPLPETLELKTQYRVLGQLFESYILLECKDNLLLLDQHAAHERNLYDGAVNAYTQGQTLSMPLLAPEIVRVSHAEKVLIDENLHLFHEIGFDIQEFGSLEYKISAIPYLFNQNNIEGILDDMMGELRIKAKEKPLIRKQSMIKAACKKAVKANMALSKDEIDKIVTDFIESATFPTCPHGRPIITAITKTEIEKGFKRIV